jgi:3-oxoadipate enol-lactonase
MPIASAGNIELSYERSGEGPALLLIMGMSGTMMHWGEPFLGALRSDFEVITYDHRGVGNSTPTREPFTIPTLAQDAAALLDALEVDSAHVLGISMGGMVAQELALSHPQRLRTLLLGCTYCGGPESALSSPEVLQALAEGMNSGDRERAIRTAWEVNVSARFASERDDAYRSFLQIGLANAVPVALILQQMQAIVEHDTSERLAQIELPTLIVHGTEDQMLPVANAQLISRYVPHAQLEILDDVGHLFFWEQPQRSAELVRDQAKVPS